MSNKRDCRVSYIRALATGMVVFLHITQHFERVYPKIHIVSDWFNLGLVMFFVLSAFLYSKREIKRGEVKSWLAHRYVEIAVPSIFTVLCACLIFSAFGIKVYGKRLIYSILCGMGFEAFVPDSWVFIQLWFLTSILICYITVPIVQKIDFKKPSGTVFWAGIILVSIVMQGVLSAVHSPVSWGVILRFYLAYAIFRRYDINSQEMKKTITGLFIISVPCLVITIILRYFMSLEGSWAKAAELCFIYTQTLLGTVLFYLLYRIFGYAKERKKLIKFTDMYSYPVYLTHCLFIGYSTSVIDMFTNGLLGTVVALVLTMISSTIVLVATKPVMKRINGIIKKSRKS